MFLRAGATLAGSPAAVRAISSMKPPTRVAITVTDAGLPRRTSGWSNFAASMNGGRSVTASATWVYSCRGGEARLASFWLKPKREVEAGLVRRDRHAIRLRRAEPVMEMFDRQDEVAVRGRREVEARRRHGVGRRHLGALGVLEHHVDLGRRMQLVGVPFENQALALLGGEYEMIDVPFLQEAGGDGTRDGHAVGLGGFGVRFLLQQVIQVAHGKG